LCFGKKRQAKKVLKTGPGKDWWERQPKRNLEEEKVAGKI
jgi:hypothetical protein